MAYYQNPVSVDIKKASPTYWGVTTQIGGVYEAGLQQLFDSGGLPVFFQPKEVNLGGNTDIFFVQQPKTFNDITETLGSQYCYPPAFYGLKCVYLNGYLTVTGIPLYLLCLVPPLNPSDQPNTWRIDLPDIGVTLILNCVGGKLSWGLFSSSGNLLAGSRKLVTINTAQWGSAYFSLYIHYFVIFSLSGRWLVVEVGIDNDVETVVIPSAAVSGYFSGTAIIHGYGALRAYTPTYNTNPLSVYNLAYPSGVAPVNMLWVADIGGSLSYCEETSYPSRSSDKYPLILRRLLVYHVPTLSVSGLFSDARMGITSVDWDTEGGSLKGFSEINIGIGDALKIIVDNTEFLYRVKSVRKEKSGDPVQYRYDLQLENPLLQSYIAVPCELNPYLLRWKDVIKAMKCCIHLDFNINYSNLAGDDDIILVNDKFSLNTLPDWCDMLIKLAGIESGAKWFIWGKTVTMQTPSQAITFNPPPASQTLSYVVETDTSMPTVGVVGSKVIVSPAASQRGISLRTGGYPIDAKVIYKVKGLMAIPENAYIQFATGDYQGRKAEVTKVRWSVNADGEAETEIELEVIGT